MQDLKIAVNVCGINGTGAWKVSEVERARRILRRPGLPKFSSCALLKIGTSG